MKGHHLVDRTLQLDYPVANVNYTRNEDEIIVAELIYSASTRYSLWNLTSIEKMDETIVPTGTEITDAQKADHPWLERIRSVHPSSQLVGAPWFSDAAHLNDGGIPAICLGPGSIDQAHKSIEYVELDQLEFAARFYEAAIMAF